MHQGRRKNRPFLHRGDEMDRDLRVMLEYFIYCPVCKDETFHYQHIEVIGRFAASWALVSICCKCDYTTREYSEPKPSVRLIVDKSYQKPVGEKRVGILEKIRSWVLLLWRV